MEKTFSTNNKKIDIIVINIIIFLLKKIRYADDIYRVLKISEGHVSFFPHKRACSYANISIFPRNKITSSYIRVD